MADKITIAQLDIDFSEIIKQSAELSKTMQVLSQRNKELAKEGKQSSEEYVRNEVALKRLRQAYTSNMATMTQAAKKTEEQTNRTQMLSEALAMEATSIEEAREQNKLLTALRNSANVTTEEGRAELEQLNAALDKNNALIKENVDAYTKQKIGIGDYKNSIVEALKETKGFGSIAENLGGQIGGLTGSLGILSGGIGGVAKGFTALAATPLIGIITILMTVFQYLASAFGKNEKAMNTLNKAFAPFSAVLNKLLKAGEPLAEFLADTLAKALEMVAEAADFMAEKVAAAAEWLGFEDAAKGVRNYVKELKEVAGAARTLVDLEIATRKQSRAIQEAVLTYETEQEKLKKIQEDTTRTFGERTKANDALAESIKKQAAEELALAKQQLQIAQLKLAADQNNADLLDAESEARIRVAEIIKRIDTAEADRLKVRNELERDARQAATDAAKARAEARIREMNASLALYEAEQGYYSKTMQEQLALFEQTAEKRKAILKAEFEAGNKTRTEYNAEVEALTMELLQKQAETTAYYAEKALTDQLRNLESQIDNEKFFSDEMARIEFERLDRVAEARKAFAEQQLSLGILNAETYAEEMQRIDDEQQVKRDEVLAQRKAAEDERAAIDLENRRAYEDLVFQDDLNIALDRLEQARKQEILAAEKTGADIVLINKKYDAMVLQMKKQAELAKLQTMQDGIAAVGSIMNAFGVKNKNMQVAMATADAFLGATKAALTQYVPGDPSSYARAVLAGATALATGMANAANIAKTENPQFERGGRYDSSGAWIAGGKSHAQGGTQYTGSDGGRFNVQSDEAMFVLNRNATSAFMAFNDAFSSFSGGGVTAAAMPGVGVDMQAVGELVVRAVAAMPAPVVGVEQVIDGVGKYVKVDSFASFP